MYMNLNYMLLQRFGVSVWSEKSTSNNLEAKTLKKRKPTQTISIKNVYTACCFFFRLLEIMEQISRAEASPQYLRITTCSWLGQLVLSVTSVFLSPVQSLCHSVNSSRRMNKQVHRLKNYPVKNIDNHLNVCKRLVLVKYGVSCIFMRYL